MITVLHRRLGESARRIHPGAAILDLTSRGSAPWVKFSPFYPHGQIPVPGAPDRSSASVEGLWQALKVFEHADVDESKLAITSMKGIKRGAGKLGRVLGHREGLGGERLLDVGVAYWGARTWCGGGGGGFDLDAVAVVHAEEL